MSKRLCIFLALAGFMALAGCGRSSVSTSSGYGSTGCHEQCASGSSVCAQVGVVE